MHWFSSHVSESVYIGSLTMYIRESAFAWDCLLLPCFAKSESVCAVGLSTMATALLHYPCRSIGVCHRTAMHWLASLLSESVFAKRPVATAMHCFSSHGLSRNVNEL